MRLRGVVVALSGPSGSGKSTVAAALARRRRWARLDEAYYRLRPRPGLSVVSQARLRALERRLLDEEARRFLEARSLASTGRTVVADTGFLDPVLYTAGLLVLDLATAATFRAVFRHARRLALRRRLGLADLSVVLSVPAATRRARVERDPTGHPRAFRPRHEAVGRVETTLLVPRLRRELPKRIRLVRAGDSVESVAGRVGAAAARTGPISDPCAAAIRALDGLERVPALRAALGRSGNLKRRTPSPRAPR